MVTRGQGGVGAWVAGPLVPEVRLHLAEDAVVWWARMEAEVGAVLTAPFWATAWPGGQALARYVALTDDLLDGALGDSVYP